MREGEGEGEGGGERERGGEGEGEGEGERKGESRHAEETHLSGTAETPTLKKENLY